MVTIHAKGLNANCNDPLSKTCTLSAGMDAASATSPITPSFMLSGCCFLARDSISTFKHLGGFLGGTVVYTDMICRGREYARISNIILLDCMHVNRTKWNPKRAANFNESPQQWREITPTVEEQGKKAGAGGTV